MDKTKANLEFVTRVGDEFHGTLNAFSALIRVEMLVDDAERAARAYAVSPPERPYAHRKFELDIVSYYSVGLVTCLEWHARSRLADLFTYTAGSIVDDDLTKDCGTKVLRQLIAANASIPQYLAATRNYSTASAYLTVFTRLFNALNIRPDPKRILHDVDVPGTIPSTTALEAFEALYDYRNSLVHEITEEQVGHPIHHNVWSWETAIAYGRFILSFMKSLEAAITDTGPSDFPNRVMSDGAPENVDDRLDGEIARLEAEINAKLDNFAPALRASRAAMEAEQEMLNHANIFYSRWFDFKAPVRRALRRGRLLYLKALREVAED